jgi:DNA-binding GntR family transcriptional regulator
MKKSTKQAKSSKPIAGSQRDRAYNLIRAKILSGVLTPKTRLSNRMLAKEVGMSFIPVREAVSQLASEGLVVHEPKLGYFVKEISREEITEWYDFREALEVHAILKAAEIINTDQLAELQSWNNVIGDLRNSVGKDGILAFEQIETLIAADAKFHLTILRVAGNRLLMKTIGHIRVMTQVFVSKQQKISLQRVDETWKEHQAIIDALKNKKGEKAKQVLSAHLRTGCARALKIYDLRMLQDAEMAL